MWVFTTFGFFSIVAHRKHPNHVLVRARDRGDLRALVKRVAVLPDAAGFKRAAPRILTTPNADYAFRAIVHRDAIGAVMQETAAEVDYDNFKTAVAKRQGHRRAKLYGDVWTDLLPLQERAPREWPPNNAL